MRDLSNTAAIELLSAAPPKDPKKPLYAVPKDIQLVGRDYGQFKHSIERFTAAMKALRPVIEERLGKVSEQRESLGGYAYHLISAVSRSFDLERAIADGRISARALKPYVKVVESFNLKAALEEGKIEPKLLQRYVTESESTRLDVR